MPILWRTCGNITVPNAFGKHCLFEEIISSKCSVMWQNICPRSSMGKAYLSKFLFVRTSLHIWSTKLNGHITVVIQSTLPLVRILRRQVTILRPPLKIIYAGVRQLYENSIYCKSLYCLVHSE